MGMLLADASAVLVNSGTELAGIFGAARLEVDRNANGTLLLARETSNNGGPTFEFLKRRSAWGVVQNGDRLGTIGFSGADSVDAAPAAYIYAEVDGTPGSNDMPGRIVLATSPDGAAGPVERVRITQAGLVGIGQATPTGQAHVAQASTTAAIPVLVIEQADLSEEMIEFVTTVGTGNPIEAVGSKTLTTTHFVRVTIPGAGYRYMPAGTIA